MEAEGECKCKFVLVPKNHARKAYGAVEVKLIAFLTPGLNLGTLPSLRSRSLPPGKELQAQIWQDSGRAPEQEQLHWRTEESFPAGNVTHVAKLIV
jgi:hypothetical protein